ncbi:hypothetical protein K505DRAFT_380462 [Melanomma pulvis-pyrius CBS 109.77]|uniref:Uncharacterized protein n=1 Tax=Melanomma pulvis-pyrius CBS 109.77 TaxID=1314802 RepID=A0A6A6WPW3_9PLEO|nr:hypothetical protein K505DRAFT_380462 [Melanomma pulvis-pyrius CBS 109.77]
MAPDLNSVPASPRNATVAQPSPSLGGMSSTQQSASRQSSTTTSRRASQIYPMSPPPLPLASPGGHVSASAHHAHPFPPLSPSFGGHVPSVDAAGVPMRHPRPLTAAELHLELEKEQEAVVNRLTRELSALRAHSASVASTASSATSAAILDGDGHHGPTHPTSARRHRSSSSVSRTSINAPYNGPTTYSTGIPLTSATSGIPHSHHRYSASSQQPGDPSSAQQARSASRSASVVSTPRYEEVAHYKQELEEAKRENETLKSRIRELERAIRGDTDNQRGRRGAPPAPGSGPRNDGAASVTPSERNTPQ